MIPAPYAAATAELLARPHRNIVRAALTHPALGVIPLVLDSTLGASLSVTFDEATAPRVQAQLTCPLPAVDVDPRQGVRLSIEAGYQDAQANGPEDVQPLADLVLRTAQPTWAHDGPTLTVTASGDESLVIDAAPAVAESVTGASHALAISTLLAKSIAPSPELQATVTGPAVTVDTIEDRWNALVDLADGIGAQLYDDGLRTWHLDATPDRLAATSHHELTIGQGGTVLEPSRRRDRDSWSNYVRVRYRWRNAAGADQLVVGTAYVTSGAYAVTGPAGRRILPIDRDVATTQARANTAARSILTRTLSRGDVLEVEAVAAYWLRPGMTVAVQLPTGATVRHLVARVVFNVLAGTMTVATRLPLALDVDNADTPSTDTGTPTTGAPKPDPVPVAKVRYVSEWTPTATACYRSDGTKRTDAPALGGVLWQGTFSGSYNGDQRSLALFGGTSSPAAGKRGESGKTIAQALTGADVERVELVATCEHAWAQAFTARLGMAGTTAPATAPTMRPYVTSSSWPEGSARTVNMTSPEFVKALKAATSLGVTLGPASSGSTAFYGRLGSLRLRITYAR